MGVQVATLRRLLPELEDLQHVPLRHLRGLFRRFQKCQTDFGFMASKDVFCETFDVSHSARRQAERVYALFQGLGVIPTGARYMPSLNEEVGAGYASLQSPKSLFAALREVEVVDDEVSVLDGGVGEGVSPPPPPRSPPSPPLAEALPLARDAGKLHDVVMAGEGREKEEDLVQSERASPKKKGRELSATEITQQWRDYMKAHHSSDAHHSEAYHEFYHNHHYFELDREMSAEEVAALEDEAFFLSLQRVNMLEVFAAMAMVCDATFLQKAKYVFELFDFDANGSLSLDEVKSMVASCLGAMCKVTGNIVPSHTDMARLVSEVMDSADSEERDRLISASEWIHWCQTSPAAIVMLARFGTTNGLAVRKRYLRARWSDRLGKANRAHHRLVLAPLQPGKPRPRSTGNPRRQRHDMRLRQSTATRKIRARRRRAEENRLAGLYSEEKVRALKSVFDSVDSGGSGVVDALELNAMVKMRNLSITLELDFTKDSYLEFSQVLERMYPDAPPGDIEAMIRWVCPKAADEELIVRIKRLFDRMDVEFTGELPLEALVNRLRRSDILAEYTLVPPLSSRDSNKTVDLHGLLRHVFSSTHHHQLKQILEWAVPSSTLTPQQRGELVTLFKRYDKDNSGTISASELREGISQLGFDPDWCAELFSMYDSDGSLEFSVHEFQAFFRGLRDMHRQAARDAEGG